MNNSSRTNWARVDALTDEQIDTSDTPALSDAFFAKAQWRSRAPSSLVSVTVRVDREVLAWFKAQGDDCEPRLTAALRLYAAAHQAA